MKTVTTIRDKYQDIVNAESALIHTSPFKAQIIRSQDERYIRYSTLQSALYAFHYTQKARVISWLTMQLQQYHYDALNSADATTRKISQWSVEAIQEMLSDLQ